MVILIMGASHTGKTLLAQRLMERYSYPVLSLDLLKMGLIRSGQTELTPEDDDLLVPYLWGIVKEMIKTAIENKQNLIVEGWYIPFDWKNDFEPQYLDEIEYICLVMSKRYLQNHSDNVVNFACAIEQRLSDDVSVEELIEDNGRILASCRSYHLPFCFIDGAYDLPNFETISLAANDLEAAARLFIQTVHTVNAKDYSTDQLNAWAPQDISHRQTIIERLSGQLAVGVKECGILLGFGSLDDEGVVDMLYVHKDRQRQGIAKAILEELEHAAAERGYASISTFSSITAKPFFESMGFVVDYENHAVRSGITLTNYHMTKWF